MYQSILENLPLLNQTQLEEVRKRCGLLLKNAATKSTGGVVDQDWVLEGILWWCERTGVYVHRTFHLKRSGSSFNGYATKSETLRALLLECCSSQLSPVQRAALGQVCATELAHRLTAINHGNPPNFKHMMDQVQQTVEALQFSFPGLLESKLLNLVVRYENGN